MVEITRILQSQPIAEGYILSFGARDTFHVWSTDGHFDRQKETDKDIVEFSHEVQTEYDND